MVVCDDNLTRLVHHEAGDERPVDLVAIIEAAAAAMQGFQAHLWGTLAKGTPELAPSVRLVLVV